MRVWVAVKDVGGMNSVMPVVRSLRSLGHAVAIFAEGRSVELLGEDVFCRFAVDGQETTKETVNRFKAYAGKSDAILTSLCSDGGRNLVSYLRGRVKTFAVQDLWGARLQKEWKDEHSHPDFMFVSDDVDRDITLKAWSDYKPERVIVAGNPAFDALAYCDVPAGAQQAKEALKLDLNPMVLFLVDYLPGGAEDLENMVRALNEVGQQVNFIPRFHPDYKNRAPKGDPEKCEVAIGQFKAGRIVRNTRKLDLMSLLSAATVVVGAWTTVLVSAAHLRRQVISLMFPELGQASFREYVSGSLDFPYPLVELGAAACARNYEELVVTLRKSFENKLGLERAQVRALRLDGRSADRIARFIQEFV